MWYLEDAKTNGIEHIMDIHIFLIEEYLILANFQCVVGRKNCDIIIENDASISRKHATLCCTNVVNNDTSHLFNLTDYSKYGTYVNGARIYQEVSLKEGDCIVFGIQQSKYVVRRRSHVVTTSLLNPDSKTELLATLKILGGRIEATWSEACDFLVMESLNATPKVLEALVALKPIVSPGYFEAMIEWAKLCRIKQADNMAAPTMPEYADFTPSVTDPTLDKPEISFLPNPDRTRLFSEITFVFADRAQLSRFGHVIRACGGTAVLLESGWRRLIGCPAAIFILTPTQTGDSRKGAIPRNHSTIRELVNEMVDDRIPTRGITESEICLAIFTATTAVYCANSTDQHRSDGDYSSVVRSSKNVEIQNLDIEPTDGSPPTKRRKMGREPTAIGSSEEAAIPKIPSQSWRKCVSTKSGRSSPACGDVWLNAKTTPILTRLTSADGTASTDPEKVLATADAKNGSTANGYDAPQPRKPWVDEGGWMMAASTKFTDDVYPNAVGTNVEVVSLCRTDRSPTSLRGVVPSGGFRRFAKSFDPTGSLAFTSDGIPKIIGGSDLIPHNSCLQITLSPSGVFGKGAPVRDQLFQPNGLVIESKSHDGNKSAKDKNINPQHQITTTGNGNNSLFNFSLKDKVTALKERQQRSRQRGVNP